MSDGGSPYKVGVPKFTALCEAQNWRCCYCGVRCDGVEPDDNSPTTEHVVPVGVGGRREWDNEVMACRRCNHGRGAAFALAFEARVRKKGVWRAIRWARQQESRRAKKRLAKRMTKMAAIAEIRP